MPERRVPTQPRQERGQTHPTTIRYAAAVAAAVERNRLLAAALARTANTAVAPRHATTRCTRANCSGSIVAITTYPGNVPHRRSTSGHATLISFPRRIAPAESGVARKSTHVRPSTSALISPDARLGTNRINSAVCNRTSAPPTAPDPHASAPDAAT